MIFGSKEKKTISLKHLIDAAVDNQIELRRLEALDGQLSPAAYLTACFNVEGASAAEATKIEKALATSHEGPLLRPSLRRMGKAIEHMKRSAPIKQLGPYMDAEADSALARLGCSRPSLFATAARLATQRPELFGTMTRPDEYRDRIEKCLAERARLLSEIEQGWGASDVVWDRDGRVALRCTGGIVAIAENFAENALNWHLREHDQAQAA